MSARRKLAVILHADVVDSTALVAEFARASDALGAALSFQGDNVSHNQALPDPVRPVLRVGISLGEVIIADATMTGAGVALAQRLEQLAPPDGIVVQDTVAETVPTRLPFVYQDLGEHTLKGFDKPVRAFAASLSPGPQVSSSWMPRSSWLEPHRLEVREAALSR